MELTSQRPSRPPPPSSEALHDNLLDQKLRKISECYETSMCHVNNALTADEQGEFPAAIRSYVHALHALEMGISVELPQNPDVHCNLAWERQEKMMKALEHVRSRLYTLQNNVSMKENEVPVPAYSEDVPENHSSLTVGDDHTYNVPQPENVVELLCIPGGVQLYHVDSNEHVSTAPPSYPTSLKVLLFDEPTTSQGSSRPPAFVQVGDWTYPLVPGRSPVLKCTNGAYVFPDVADTTASRPGSVGVVISAALDPSYREIYESILSNYGVLQIQQQLSTDEPAIDLSSSVDYRPAQEIAQRQPTLTDKVVGGIETGASWISWGLGKGAELTNSLIKKSATRIQRNITPEETPASVNPNLQKGLKYTNDAAKMTYKVSGAMVKGLTIATTEVAKRVAPYVRSCADSVLPSGGSDGKNETTDNVLAVAGAGLAGIGAVWTSLEGAGVAIARAVSTATVDTVQFKYGEEAGLATKNITGAAVSFGRAAFNIDNFGIKAIAKQTAKSTGKEFLKTYVEERENKKLGVVGGVSASDGSEKMKKEVQASKN